MGRSADPSPNPLTAATLDLFTRLLAWDRQRIAASAARFGSARDFRPYRARQDRAEAALSQRPAAWTAEVREYFQTLIETCWNATERATNAAAAVEIGADGPLREVQPALFD